MDVKHLRTNIRHDLDHGDARDVKKKLLRAGSAFEKFSGKKSPAECGPDEFLMAQTRTLQALLAFLASLQET